MGGGGRKGNCKKSQKYCDFIVKNSEQMYFLSKMGKQSSVLSLSPLTFRNN